MNIEIKHGVAVVREPGVLVTDVSSALDLIATVRYETGCTAMVLPKEALDGAFFRLSTHLAGEVLQKFVNYQMALAIVGDFSEYQSENLKDFIYESNKGKTVRFAATEAEAVSALAEM